MLNSKSNISQSDLNLFKNKKDYIVYGSLLVVPIFMAIISAFYFNKSYNTVSNQIASSIGTVAGTQTNQPLEISKEIPIIPNSEISSIDTFNETTSITLTSNQSIQQIQSFYDDYLFLNNWIETEQHTYKKEDKILKIEYTENFIKINYSENNWD